MKEFLFWWRRRADLLREEADRKPSGGPEEARKLGQADELDRCIGELEAEMARTGIGLEANPLPRPAARPGPVPR